VQAAAAPAANPAKKRGWFSRTPQETAPVAPADPATEPFKDPLGSAAPATGAADAVEPHGATVTPAPHTPVASESANAAPAAASKGAWDNV